MTWWRPFKKADQLHQTAATEQAERYIDDWAPIPIPEFDATVEADERLTVLAGHLIVERLPYSFDGKAQYLRWRDSLAEGFGLDARDITLVGSAATGRSLNPQTKYGVFKKKSDIDIAVVSMEHFDSAWSWFRRTDPNLIAGLDGYGRELFEKHRTHYIFDGVVAAEYFLGYLPFGDAWLKEMQRSEGLLPHSLRGRFMSVRIYRDSLALRDSQVESLRKFRLYRENSSRAPEATNV